MRSHSRPVDIHAALRSASTNTRGCRGIRYRPTRNSSATIINLVGSEYFSASRSVNLSECASERNELRRHNKLKHTHRWTTHTITDTQFHMISQAQEPAHIPSTCRSDNIFFFIYIYIFTSIVKSRGCKCLI